MPEITLSPKVLAFAEEMQRQLDANLHKGDWNDWDNKEEIWDDLNYHKQKLFVAMKSNDVPAMKEYIGDCGNILMFLGNTEKLWDNQ